MFKKLWNLMSLMVIACGLSHAGEIEVNIGQLRGVYASHARDIEAFLREAPAKCEAIFNNDLYRTKKQKQEFLNDLNVFLYGNALDFSSTRKCQNSRISCYMTVVADIDKNCGDGSLLFQSLTESDLAEEELWSLAQYQIMFKVISSWHEDGLTQYFDSRRRCGILSHGLSLQSPSCTPSQLVRHLLESQTSDDVLGEMMRRIESLK